jgi:hypothetical protein
VTQLTTLALLVLVFLPAFAKKDKSNDYRMGTFVAAEAVSDGTLTNTVHGDGTTVAGDVYTNQVVVYQIKVTDGTWYVETMRQALDAEMRNLGTTPPQHLKSEKANPLDSLKAGNKVLFRLEKHHKLNGTETDMYIPFADNPSKEVKFATRFVPNVAGPKQSKKATDNVKAMCDSGRLSAELKKQYCKE